MPKHRDRGAEIMLALFASTQKVFVEFVGRFMVAEFVAAIGLLRQNNLQQLNRLPELRSVLIGFGILFCSLLISDTINASSQNDSLRGLASVLFALISTIFLTGHMRRSAYAPHIFLVGTALSSVIFFVGELDLSAQLENTNYFKVRFVPILVPIVAVGATIFWGTNRILSATLFFVTGAIFFAFDARSMGAVLVLASGLLAVQIIGFRPKFVQIFIIAVIGTGAAYAGYVYYVDAVLNHGFGGTNAQQLARLDNPYNPFELLLVGRPELRVTAAAVSDNPIVGHGSWAKDKTGEYWWLLLTSTGTEYRDLSFDYEKGMIPAHSVILTAWLWAGIGGLLGILIVYWTVLRIFLNTFWINSKLAPVLCLYFLDISWAFCFSPFGHIRTSFPFVIAIFITAALQLGQKKSTEKKLHR